MQTLTKLATTIVNIINDVLVPLVFAVAFLLFVFGVFRYFIAGADNPEKRAQGGQFVLFAVIGFAAMVSVWGLVNILTGTFALDKSQPCLPTLSTTGGSGTGCATQTSTGSNLLSPETLQDIHLQAEQETGSNSQLQFTETGH